MPNTEIRLWNDRKTLPGTEEPFQPYLKPYLLPGDTVRGCVIVFPGGGYSNRAGHEGAPVAERFNRLGFHAVVVEYRVAPYRYPAPQEDALRAIKIIRAHAAEWGNKPDKIAILGFSAGGHLACSAGIVFDEVKKNLPKAFKKTNNLEKALIITKTYKNSKEEIATKVGFYGYDTTRKTKQYPKGTPIPLIVLAREYGTSSGEKKIPILRPAFRKKKAIESAMLKVQDSYLPKE